MMAEQGVYTCIFLFLVTCLTFADANQLARGWGDEIDWVTLDVGLAKAQDLKRPLMLIIHKTWCGACRALKPKFAENDEIAELSKHFIMVNTEDDEEPKGEKYTPDGGYIPRILFLDSDGNVQLDIYNTQGNEQYKHYYPSPEHIVTSMMQAKEKLVTSTLNPEL